MDAPPLLGCDSLAEEAAGADRGAAPRPPLPGRRLQARAPCSPLPFLPPSEVTKGELEERGPDRPPAQLPGRTSRPWRVSTGPMRLP